MKRGPYNQDITGQRFGKLVVTGPAPTLVVGPKRSHRMWAVRCDCGVEKAVKRMALGAGLKSCGCGQAPKPLGFGVAQQNRILANYRRQARLRGFTWELTEEQASNLFRGDCHYCGATPTNVARPQANSGEFVYNGIDRKDSSLGYTPENTVSCCGLCNRCKSNLPYNEFVGYLQRISRFWGKCSEATCLS